MPIPLLAMLGMGGAAGAGAGGMGAGLAGLLGKGGGIAGLSGAGAPGLSQVGAASAAMRGGAPAMGGVGGAPGGDFWGQFTQMLKGPGGAANKVDMAGTLMAGQGDAERRLSSTFRGPTMPFLPHLNTNQVGPNQNPGQIGLAQLLQQMAQRRG